MHTQQHTARRRAHSGIRRRILLGAGLVALALALGFGRTPARADTVYDPEIVKAGVIAQITRFVEWPDAMRGPHPQVVDIVFLGPSRVADALRAIGSSRFRVRVVRQVADIGAPHALFVSRAFDGSLPDALRSVDRRPVLVIGDGPSVAARGASFGLRDDGSRVRIEVNRRSLARAQLRVSYHVLRLATEVNP